MEQARKYGWSNWVESFRILRKNSDPGWVLGLLKILLLTIKLLDPFELLKNTTLFFLKKSNIKNLSNVQPIIVDTIVVLKFIIAVSVFFLGLYSNFIWFILILLLAITTVTSIPEAILFEDTRPSTQSYSRATVLGIINYTELVFHFASLYSFYNCLRISGSSIGEGVGHEQVIGKIDYLYFSFITVSTIGYGHLTIVNNIGYILVICQAFVFLLFVLVFINLNVGRINECK